MPGPLQSMCGTCRPRWARLVDNVYPADSNNRQPKGPKLNSLTHYTCRYPEKLGRIANYLEKRMQRDLYRRRTGHAFVTASIVDNLVKCCQRLDGMVCAYLSMVTSLLECEDRELQILGSMSFCAYSSMDKETPNDLREYAGLLERFVRMCMDSSAVSGRVRCSGLRGVAGLVRKIGSDDLQLNIWQELYMTQIVGAILFNLEDPPPVEMEDVRLDDEDGAGGDDSLVTGRAERPFNLAKEAMDELLTRATFHNYGCVISPVLAHLDSNPSLWVPNSFALLVFRTLVTRAPKPGYAYTVVERLIAHLNSPTVAGSTPVRQCVVQVVAGIVGFAASDSVGPAVYNVFKELCCQLVRSLTCGSPNQPSEHQYRQELVLTMARYAEAAPDTHKLEIMKYLITYEAPHGLDANNEDSSQAAAATTVSLNLALLRAVAMVADAYRAQSLSGALPADLLTPLLHLAGRPAQPGQRAAAQEVLAALLDRRRCRGRICPRPLTIYAGWPTEDADLDWDSTAAAFPLSRAGRQLLDYLAGQLISADNRADNLELLAICACLLAVQCARPVGPGLAELHRLWVLVQEGLTTTAVPANGDGVEDGSAGGSVVHRSAALAALAVYVSMMCHATGGAAGAAGLRDHVMQVIKLREEKAPHLLPRVAFNRSNTAKSYPSGEVPAELLFSVDTAEAELRSIGLSTASLRLPFEVPPSLATFGLPGVSRKRGDANDYEPRQGSGRDVQRQDSIWSLNFPAERRASRAMVGASDAERAEATMDVSFGAFRGIMFESMQDRSRRRANEDQQLKELYTTATFDELLELSRQSRAEDGGGGIPEILRSLRATESCDTYHVDEDEVVVDEVAADRSSASEAFGQQQERRAATIKEIEFPALFAY